MFRKIPLLVFLLHAYVGWRLLPDLLSLSAIGFGATAFWLAASLVATPLWPIARRVERQPLKDRLTLASMLAIGSFSSLFVFTLIRDLVLLVTAVAGSPAVEAAVRQEGAVAVAVLAALATSVGYV